MRMAVFFFAFTLFASGLNIAEAGASPSTPITSGSFIEHSPIYPKEIESNLYEAISSRLGHLTDGRGLTITVTTVRALYGESFGKRESISIGTPHATSGRSCPKPPWKSPRVSARWYSSKDWTMSASCAMRIRFTTPRLQGASCCLISINPINIGEAG
jgi:hypothetical protein